MKVSTLLTAMALLVGAVSFALNENLNNILEVIPTPTEMSAVNYWNFVEDLSHLSQGIKKCQEPFFCKAYDILLHKNFSKLALKEKKLEKNLEKKILKEKVEKITRELKIYIDHQKMNCSLALENVRTSNITTDVSQFWTTVQFCIRARNFHGPN